MLVTLVHVHVLPDHVADFIEATRPNPAGAVAEPGCFRFDVLQAPDDPTRFVLYEAYRDAAAAAAHGAADSFRRARPSFACFSRKLVPSVFTIVAW